MRYSEAKNSNGTKAGDRTIGHQSGMQYSYASTMKDSPLSLYEHKLGIAYIYNMHVFLIKCAPESPNSMILYLYKHSVFIIKLRSRGTWVAYAVKVASTCLGCGVLDDLLHHYMRNVHSRPCQKDIFICCNHRP